VILELAERVPLSPKSVFYDLGSGLGKVALLVHLLTHAPCIGVEIDPAYCAYAQSQAELLGLSEVSFIHADARQLTYSSGEVFFLFNPFGGQIFNAVLDKLHQVAQQRPITICSYGPCTPPLAELPWLRSEDPTDNSIYKLAIFHAGPANNAST